MLSLRERINRLREERNQIAYEQGEIVERDDATAEDWERWDKLDEDFRAKDAELRRLETQLRRNEERDEIDPETRVVPQPEESPEEVRGRALLATDEYRSAWENWARLGNGELSAEDRSILQNAQHNVSRDELRALGIATGSIGGYAVPEGFLNEIEREMLFFGSMMEVARVIRTSTGNPLPWPTVDDTSNTGRLIAENTTVTQTDVSFGQKQLNAFLYSSDAVLVPYTLMQDEAIGLEDLLASLLGERLGRIENTHWTTGTGTGQPEGITTNVTTGKTGATGQTATVTSDDLIDLIHSVDRAYRQMGRVAGGAARGPRFMMHDLSLAIVRKLKDGEGRPIYQFSDREGEPDRLHGYPVSINNDVPQMAADAKSILFGDFFRGYIIRIVRDMQLLRLTERYADALQVGFFAFMRMDGRPVTTSAVKAYVNSSA